MLFVNPATLLTFGRIAVAPLFAYSFMQSFQSSRPLFWLCISLAALTAIELSDMFDGMIARARHEVTEFGKLFDPLADAMARQTVFLAFVIVNIIPLWLFLIFLYRDAIMSALRIMIAFDGRVQAARPSGKLKAVIQGAASFLVVGAIIAPHLGIPGIPLMILGKHIGFWIMLIPAIASVVSFFDYLIPNFSLVKMMMTPQQKQNVNS